MKKLILCVFTAFLFVTCNDPIFYNISQEEKKLDPKIPGSPTNFVVFKNDLYVASGEILFMYQGTNPRYNDRGLWSDKLKPGGMIFELAATNDYLYVLCKEKTRNVLKQSSDGVYWDEVFEVIEHNIMSIHVTNNQLFIGAGTIDNFYILNGKTFEKLADTGNMLINGAAFNGTYYLTAKDLKNDTGGCIYTGSLTPGGMTSIGSSPYVGIINLGNSSQTIVAIDQTGRLYNVPALNQITRLSKDKVEFPATGALAVWENENENKLLLAGRQDFFISSTSTGYTYGYMELRITDTGTTGSFDEPGLKIPSSVNEGDNGKYKSSLGKYPIKNIIQYIENDGKKTLFASTQKEGVYSYRERNESWNWNAEQ